MASTSALSMALPITRCQKKPTLLAGSDAFFHPLRLTTKTAAAGSARLSACRSMEIRASGSLKEKAVAGITTAALVAALVVPDIAEAAQPGLSPSLKNFIFSILSGGGVLVAIIGVVVGVSNFDPVRRG